MLLIFFKTKAVYHFHEAFVSKRPSLNTLVGVISHSNDRKLNILHLTLANICQQLISLLKKLILM